jgi:hypothetical protein
MPGAHHKKPAFCEALAHSVHPCCPIVTCTHSPFGSCGCASVTTSRIAFSLVHSSTPAAVVVRAAYAVWRRCCATAAASPQEAASCASPATMRHHVDSSAKHAICLLSCLLHPQETALHHNSCCILTFAPMRSSSLSVPWLRSCLCPSAVWRPCCATAAASPQKAASSTSPATMWHGLAPSAEHICHLL